MRYLSLSIIISGILISSCATRTKYGPHLNIEGGYSSIEKGDGITMARFAGNGKTHPNDAFLFSMFRSIEICKSRGYKYSRILGVSNLSQSKTVTRSSNYKIQQPTSFNGSYKENTTLSSNGPNNINASTSGDLTGQFSGGSSFGGASSWQENLIIPTFDTYFTCENKIKIIGAAVEFLASSKVSKFSKDYLDAVLIRQISLQSPNKTVLKVGDIVLKVNGNRVQNPLEFSREIEKGETKTNLTILREGKRKEIEVSPFDGSKFLASHNNDIIMRGCSVPENKTNHICKQYHSKIRNMASE